MCRVFDTAGSDVMADSGVVAFPSRRDGTTISPMLQHGD